MERIYGFAGEPLKTDVLPSKKIKSETYYLYVDYEIGTDGQVESRRNSPQLPLHTTVLYYQMRI